MRCCRAAAAGDNPDLFSAAAGDNPDLFSANETQVIATPVQAPQHRINLYSLCRREKAPWGTHKPWGPCDVNTKKSVRPSVFVRDYRPVINAKIVFLL